MSQIQQKNIDNEQQIEAIGQKQFQNQNNHHNQKKNRQQNEEIEQNQNHKDFKQVLIKISDIQPEDQCSIVSISNSAIEEVADMTNISQTQKYSKIAGIIKKQIDQQFGEGWYVIVGKNFGSYVTHQKGSFLHFTFDDLHICVFRAR